MSIERVYGQDVVNQGALYIAVLVKTIADIDDGRARDSSDDIIMELAMEWAEQFGEVNADGKIVV
tara:strand:+ start:122 stop:316 length:195 start_codon:yes stop_codon:yes gene_type:complete